MPGLENLHIEAGRVTIDNFKKSSLCINAYNVANVKFESNSTLDTLVLNLKKFSQVHAERVDANKVICDLEEGSVCHVKPAQEIEGNSKNSSIYYYTPLSELRKSSFKTAQGDYSNIEYIKQ